MSFAANALIRPQVARRSGDEERRLAAGGTAGCQPALRGCVAAVLAVLLFVLPVPVHGADGGWIEIPQGRYRALDVSAARTKSAGFTLLPPSQTGIDFTNLLAQERSITNHVLLNGSGVAAGDVDGDGRVDLYFCGLDGPNKLYRNLGNWRFEDITAAAGVACEGLDATGAVLADIDGDGDLDLIVNSIAGGTHVFLNDGHGHFSPSPRSPILNGNFAGTSMALADMDGDGALDLYIANYRPMFFFLDKPETRYTFRMIQGVPHVVMIDGKPLTDPEYTNRFVFQIHAASGRMTVGKEELGQVDSLYRNDGHGGFTLVPFTGGAFRDEEGKVLTEPPRDWGLSVMFRDLNGDGFPDLYVCNDFRTPDRIWLNDGSGHFRAIPRLAVREISLSSMGVDVADINRDGWFDIFVGDMLATSHSRRLMQRIDLRPEALPLGAIDNRPQFSRNTLQLSRGDGTFAEIAQSAGLEASDWTWSPIFLDVDLDGYEDLLVANGFERDTMDVDMQRKMEALKRARKLSAQEQLNLRKLLPRLNTPNLAFRNRGDGTFENVSAEWGFDTLAVSQGMCLADLDNDGDLDVVINNLNGAAGVYRNNAGAPRLAVRLNGSAPNTRGIGAKIEVLGGPVYQSQEMICGGRYCSSDDPMRTFAAGSLSNSLTIRVTWRSGKRTEISGAKGNRIYEIQETSAQPAVRPAAPEVIPYFREVSRLLAHQHAEPPFDDFEVQPLLPRRLSQSGPGVSWFDLDGDGWDDLIIGSGAGGPLAVFRNDGQGGFQPMNRAAWSQPNARALTQVLGWRKKSGSAVVLAGLSSYEDGQSSGAAVQEFDPAKSAAEMTVPAARWSTGPLAMADVDGHGALDLFVGGRVIPGRYPEAASSRIFRNDNGAFVPDETNNKVFEKVGMVNGAVFADLRGNGSADLILACEWGPIRVFRNDRGHFAEVTHELGLDQFKGWWNGVAVGDFDGDGRMDIVASNWGRNSRYEQFRGHPLRMYYGDFNGDGSAQFLEAFFDPGMKKYVPWQRLDEAAKALPFLEEKFPDLKSFSTAGIEEILGQKIQTATVLEANWLESTVFLNRGGHFQPVILPLEAQLAPAFAASVGDLDGDGFEDIFLSQNFFAVPPEISRYDAGRGLWLRGDGKGNFTAVSGASSGLFIYGEQRGAALGDYDRDGRLDLVVTQNSAETKLFHNDRARPGIRVRLKGDQGNPDGVGAVLRLVSERGLGPAREIVAGSGYWSQESVVQVMAATGEAATAIWVRWPGGKTMTRPVPPGAREITVDPGGNVQVVR